MGRGKHMTHKEESLQLTVKVPKSIYKILQENRIAENTAEYLRELIYKDLRESKLLPV